MTPRQTLTIIGGGLAGSEAAWQAAKRGLHVRLFEMRPAVSTGAHQTADLAELVCSNSLGSIQSDRSSGVLKEELRRMDSLLLSIAEKASLPAGSALAVDRDEFAHMVTSAIQSNPNIELIREEVSQIPRGLTVVASGPLTSPSLSSSIATLTGEQFLYFFDAIAPTVSLESINMEIAFRGSRFNQGDQDEGDYINCPFTEQEYLDFVDALIGGERFSLKEFEAEINFGITAGLHKYFEGCLPVEVIARRGIQSLAFGPMRPIGLRDPRTGKGVHAIVQLRQDNLTGSLYNLVGFQTNLTHPEQRRILRMIPGLENAEFIRYGQMHRNTFIASPRLLSPTLQFRTRADLFFAGQITGVEGYMGNIATGLLAGWNAARVASGLPPLTLPRETMLGSLCHYISNADMKVFQPMKANFGILPPLEMDHRIGRRERSKLYAQRAIRGMEKFLQDFDN